jgi:hypothetical protein
MALKIQLRRDITANWTSNNPLLLNGEVGIETDTLRFKVGNGTQRWNDLPDYILKPGSPNGVATLNSDGKIPLSQIPNQVSLDSEALSAIQNALSSITTHDIPEYANLYFTNARAINAVDGLFDLAGSATNALNLAKADATTKMNAATTIASGDATTKANQTFLNAKANWEQFTNTAINSLTTSDIEEGSRLYFTNSRVENVIAPLISNTKDYVDQEILNTKNYFDSSLSSFDPAAAINSTSDLLEGSNLYFTNARAVTATQSARTAVLVSALGAVDDLRTEIQNDLNNYIPVSEINVSSGIAGLDSSGKLSTTLIPSSIARTSDISSAIANVVNSAPASFDTLKEIADYIASDQSAGTALTTSIATKLSISTAQSTYAPIASPTFTGTVTIPAGAAISGYATSINLTAALAEAKAYTDTAKNGIDSSLGDYALISDRNIAGGYAGLDVNGKILISAVPTISNSMLEKSSITINGTSISLGQSVITGYTNGMSTSNINKITYGISATPPSSGNSAGDIYIQY